MTSSPESAQTLDPHARRLADVEPAAGNAIGSRISPFASASEHVRSLASHAVTSRELVGFYAARIREHNPRLHAIVVSNESAAISLACARDAESRAGILQGPLHGIPVTVKEAFNLENHKTTVNLPRLANNVAPTTAFVVGRLAAAGALILGKTNVPQLLADYQSFGPLYPTANNPFDLTRTPGGSSGGGAAAVAAGLTTFEIGSDLAGSIRVPAHFCGVFGLKPTENAALCGEGHVPPLPNARGGLVTMASIGPLARSVDDIALAWRSIGCAKWGEDSPFPEGMDATIPLGDLKIAWFDDLGSISCGEETKRILAAFMRILQSAGVTIKKHAFDGKWLNEAYSVWGFLLGAMLGQNAPWLVRYLVKRQFRKNQRKSAIGLFDACEAGVNTRMKEFTRVLKRRADLVQELQFLFAEYDFIISPVAAGPAIRHNPEHRPIDCDGRCLAYFDYAVPFTLIYNVCGNPALVVPAGTSADGLPIGLQIAAPHHAEIRLIQFGKALEQLGLTFRQPNGY